MMTPAEMLYHAGDSLWCNTGCVGGGAPVSRDMAALMEEPRPGDPVIITHTLRSSCEDLVGRLLRVEVVPWPDWEDGEPNPGREVWTIVTLDDRLLRWENVQVLRLPRHHLEPEWRRRHPDQRSHFSGWWPATMPSGQCQVCEWEEERLGWLRQNGGRR